jgi:hypothetical protein
MHPGPTGVHLQRATPSFVEISFGGACRVPFADVGCILANIVAGGSILCTESALAILRRAWIPFSLVSFLGNGPRITTRDR